jgi:hypothetical protein
MTDTPKDKRAAALERIKALSARRSSVNAPGAKTKQSGGGGPQKGAPKPGGVGHRPQGG